MTKYLILIRFNPYSPGFSIYLETEGLNEVMMGASILIHLDFLSIQIMLWMIRDTNNRFNPYSPGFSIYLLVPAEYRGYEDQLQSLFTWIFYLFKNSLHLLHIKDCFNPYSPGFSIYLHGTNIVINMPPRLQSLFTWIFYLFGHGGKDKGGGSKASILIHLDFLSI